ncbi:MAG: poly(3-hydroxybutyrate) depolymerase [Gammaproteobacteria bacterium]|nr:poly(3-hydroxybutyrate) depolymerase [Gammaproteobacteria bacterium]
MLKGCRSLCLVMLALAMLCACERYDKESLLISSYTYPEDLKPQCMDESLQGQTASTDDLKTTKGIRFNVRTPANYNSQFAHPLLVVYAPAGRSRRATERFTGLTQLATETGFIVAYVDSRQLSIAVIEELGSIPDLIASQWCVDKQRIFLTGHSDGGTVAHALAFLDSTRQIPAAIAPSAAGINGEEIAEQQCPEPLPVMVIHNSDDRYFPGFGAQTVTWWAGCNQCSKTPVKLPKAGCIVYPDCANDVQTMYCEQPGTHSSWPQLNKVMLDFFLASRTQ